MRIKKHLKKLIPYAPDSIDYKIRLNANESPFNETIKLLNKIKAGSLSSQLKKNSINRLMIKEVHYTYLLKKNLTHKS